MGEGEPGGGLIWSSSLSWKELGAGKTNVISPAARAAVVRREASSYSCVGLRFYPPETLGLEAGTGEELGETQRLEEGGQHRPLSPGSAHQPRFRQSKVMTPFSSGVHLMPGETKAGPFTGSVRRLQSPSWVLTSKNAMIPREGPAMDLDNRVRGP